MTLRIKAAILSALIFSGLIIIMLVGVFTLKTASSTDNANRVEQLLKSTYSTVEELERMAAEGVLTDEQARMIATRILRNNKYNNSEYVYVADENMDFVATPLEPEFHGTSFHEFKDASGKSVGNILLKAVERSRSDITEYPWKQKKSDGSVEDKLSIAKKSPRWNWVVGTGIGFNEVNARFWSSAGIQLTLCVVITIIIAIPFVMGVRNVLRGLGGELDEVSELVRSVAEGDISYIDSVHKSPKGSIYSSVIKMRKSLREMITNLATAVSTLQQVSDEIVVKAQESDARADNQSRATDMIASSAEEFNVQTQQASQHSDAARDQTKQASVISTKGHDQIVSAVSQFNEIDSSVGLTQASIDELAQRVDSISAVISVISEVANQTNLLALNAAIEAARAGDQGRGFAVVADEVRQLAGRTSQATQEISDTITAVQTSSRKAKENMDEMVEQLKEGIEQTKMGGDAVQAIRSETDTVAQIVAEITQVLSEQVEASNIIREYVHQVELSASESKDAASETLTSSQSIRSASEQLSTMIEQFRV